MHNNIPFIQKQGGAKIEKHEEIEVEFLNRFAQVTHISLKLEIFYYKEINRIAIFRYFEIIDPLFTSKFNEICVKFIERLKETSVRLLKE